MAIKFFHLVFLVLLLLAPIGNAKRNIPSDKKSSSFDFINKLKGCHKGNHTKEVHELKAYLEKFGYLKYFNKTHANDDYFDETLESAIKTYQTNYHIKPSGIIDTDTVSRMTTPRCGVADIINGTNYMQPHKRKHESNSSSIHTVSHFKFFQGNPKWPPTKTHLAYRLGSNFRPMAIDPVARAFGQWASATHFTFARVEGDQADILVEFHRGYHGDNAPFDGRGNIVAHAFPPTDGRIHYDDDELWSSEPTVNSFHLETVAVHEIGHVLGLGHSDIEAAIMFSSISAGQVKNLHADDIQGIKTLYNR